MQGRLRANIATALSLVMTMVVSPASGQVKVDGLRGPSDPVALRAEVLTPVASKRVEPASLVVQLLFGLYQRGIGPTKGTHCPMLPSCSEYGRICVAQHGLLLGVMMTADRLHRCGHDLYLYQRLWSVSKGWCYDDPPR